MSPHEEHGENRKELEQHYRQRLEACRAKYDQAKTAAETARLELSQRVMPEPDGSQAYRNALAAERSALQAYRQALTDFNRLILDGAVPAKEEPQPERPAILVLDDEQMVREIISTALARAGYRVLASADADEAIAAAAAYRGDIALFITNHLLPDGRTGREVAIELLKSRPAMAVLHISGFPEKQLRQERSILPTGHYLRKPFLPRQLVSKVEEMLGKPAGGRAGGGAG